MNPVSVTLSASLLIVFVLISVRLYRNRRLRSAVPYEPAVARIEGGGIKRGLTPPEASVLLGKPLNLTLTLVIFEMLRKGFLKQETPSPFTVGVDKAFGTRGSMLSVQERSEKRRKAAQKINAALHLYEEPFLEIIEANPGKPVHQLDFGIAVQPLVRYVAGRVAGFNLQETRDYYRLIIERAPKEARSDGTLTFEREKVFDRNFGWVILGEDFERVFDQEDYSYVPVWLRTSDVQRPESGKIEANFPHGKHFATWAKEIINSMEGVILPEDVKFGLGSDEDAVTATLMSEIARATFYG